MDEPIYVFNGKDITLTICLQIRAVVRIIRDELGIDFFEALPQFYCSHTYQVLTQVENGFWAESAEYIADFYFEELIE